LFNDIIKQHLAARLPDVKNSRSSGPWAGHYDYNSFDRIAFWAHTRLETFLFRQWFFFRHWAATGPGGGRRPFAELISPWSLSEPLDLSDLGF